MNEPLESPAFQRLHTYFLANVTHEFQTPLASLGASLEILLDEVDDLSSAERRDLLRSMQISASSLRVLVNNLLESTSIQAGHFTIHPRPVVINQVLAQAVYIMQPLLDRREQSLVLTEPIRLPILQADPIRLTQVFVNLLSNASKYSPTGQKIDLGIDIMGDHLLIAVADRGPGIPEAERADVFRHFTRLAVEDSAQYGAGLGLSVVKSILEGHGGSISIDDRPGGGCIFWIMLPCGGRDS